MRNRMMVAAIEEINENGIKFTMAELAKRLAVSKSTLYTQFTSKEELIGAIVDSLLTQLCQQDEAILHDGSLSTHDKLKALLANQPTALGPVGNRFILDLKRYWPEEWKKSEAYRDGKWQRIEGLLKQGIVNGYFRPVDLTIAKVIFIAAINELLSPRFLLHNNLTFTDAVGKMADILYFGMAVEKDDGNESLGNVFPGAC